MKTNEELKQATEFANEMIQSHEEQINRIKEDMLRHIKNYTGRELITWIEADMRQLHYEVSEQEQVEARLKVLNWIQK